MTRLAGKSREQIGQATKHWTRQELLDALFKAISVEVMLSPRDLAAVRGISKRTVLELIHDGTLPAYQHLKNGEYRIRVSDVHAWDEKKKVKLGDAEPTDVNGVQPNESEE